MRINRRKSKLWKLISPEDWLGYWEGKLEIFNSKGLVKSIPMALDHQKTDTLGVYKWAIIYGEDLDKGRRDYYLKTIDEKSGFYKVDEKNSILLDSYLIGNQLFSTFEVSGTLITSIYRLEDDKIHFEIIASNTNEPNITGNETVDGEEIPGVKSYKSTAFQRAVLNKKTLSN